MCDRQQGEGLGAYFVRLAITRPSNIFWMIGFIAAAWIYSDFIRINNQFMTETVSALREITVRLERLERRQSEQSAAETGSK